MSRVMQMPPPPPLLLTKRVTAFLRANLSAHIHSAMLTTPAGSLLAHASDLPASALRRQAAVAASLWALQGPAHGAPPSPGPAQATLPTGSTVRTTRKSGKHAPTVTVQLDSGAVFVIRRLRCGMLFICMGGSEGAVAAGRQTPTPPAPHNTRLSRSPAPTAPPTPGVSSEQAQDAPSSSTNPSNTATPAPQPPTAVHTHPPFIAAAERPPPTTPPTTTATTTATTTTAATTPASKSTSSLPVPPGAPVGSPSESSVFSTHTTRTTGSSAAVTVSGSSVSLMRRQVEELARWLDERLGPLCVPEEGIGIQTGALNPGSTSTGREGSASTGVEVQ
ncbi:hypothetical protein C8A03DRAFT_29058 [Achaetomium macrosporum]|uniref:Uncharacterized protein n=1 Tax=Achaetomium macrosporum TaxID=79813 RepID=A0AAN7HAN9_9PEZI|nr:hypothetical protein C8A03DRAFT_29058 [Achaetomium macrosporum]